MVQLIKCEINKIKTLKPLIAAFLLPLTMVIIGLINVYKGSVHVTDILDAIYNQSSMLYGGIILPLTVIIIITLQWRIEYKNNNIINLYSSPIQLWKLYFSKVITTFIIVFVNIIIFISVLLIFFKLQIINESIPFYFVFSPLIAVLFSIPLVVIQHLLAMSIRNFITPIALGLIFTFTGFILSGANSLSAALPYTYIYSGLFFCVPNRERIFHYIIFFMVPLWTITIFFLGVKIFKSRKV